MNKELFELFKEYHNANYHDGDNTFDFRTYKTSNGEDLDDDFVASCWEHFEYAWNKQQETIDEQFEMLVNQAKTIMEKNKRIEELEKTLKEFYYVSDAATIFKVKENLEKYDE